MRTASEFASCFLSSGQAHHLLRSSFFATTSHRLQPDFEVLSFLLFSLLFASLASAAFLHLIRRNTNTAIRGTVNWASPRHRAVTFAFGPRRNGVGGLHSLNRCRNSQLNGITSTTLVFLFMIHDGSPDPRRGGCTTTTRRDGVQNIFLVFVNT